MLALPARRPARPVEQGAGMDHDDRARRRRRRLRGGGGGTRTGQKQRQDGRKQASSDRSE